MGKVAHAVVNRKLFANQTDMIKRCGIFQPYLAVHRIKLGAGDQQEVACCVSKCVVHRFEAVEVEEQNGDARGESAALEAKSLGLRGEQPGIVPSPEWKQKTRGAEWNPGETINSSIGQGDTLTTPLQLAVMTARMVNGGKKILPHLVVGEDVKNEGDIDIAPEHLAIIREGMERVANSPRGTAYGSTIKDEKYKFGGKTGTSQVRKLLVQGQNQNELPWEFRHHAWFVGYAPIHAPEISCAVIIEHGGGGAADE